MKKTKKTKYPQFSIKRLKKRWPFSLHLAEKIFSLNQFGLYSSLRDFFVFTASELEEELESLEENSASQRNKKVEKMGLWYISEYPGFFIENNKVYYQESVISKIKNTTEEELITQNYNLDTIPYQTFVFEGTKFYINNFLQGAVLNLDIQGVKVLSLSLIWAPVFNYLVFTTCSSSMRNMLENQNYKKNHKGTILLTFQHGFKQLTPPKGSNRVKFQRLLSRT